MRPRVAGLSPVQFTRWLLVAAPGQGGCRAWPPSCAAPWVPNGCRSPAIMFERLWPSSSWTVRTWAWLANSRVAYARYLADTLEHDAPEDWTDAPVQVNVEIEARDRSTQPVLFGLWRRPYTGLRRGDSLYRAFTSSHSQHILLGGEPGSGKSVALRTLLRELAEVAARATNSESITLPIYIDLKDFRRQPDQRIDAALLKSYITETLTASNDYNVRNLIDDEFEERLQSSGWIFLFDSFDEIPDILSATGPFYVGLLARYFGEGYPPGFHGRRHVAHGHRVSPGSPSVNAAGRRRGSHSSRDRRARGRTSAR